MSDLFVVAFEGELKAEQVRLDLLSLKHRHLVDLEEAVVVVRTASGKVRMHHSTHFTVPAAVGGGFLGMMVGLMLLNPILAVIGGISGTALGGVVGALKELGIDEAFMKELASHLKLESSALFILVKEGQPEKIYAEVKKFGGKILQTKLAHQDEAKLAAALNTVKK
jgi:uncharacterized membrane protein